MHKRKRFQLILTAVEAQGIVTVQELMERLSASSATVRRDIGELAKAGDLLKVHGGAEALGHSRRSGARHYSLDYAHATSLHQKIAIATLAVSLCNDDESIIINGGSTTYQMVHALQKRSMQVLTNSLPIASYLFENSNVRLQVPGGEVYRDQHIILSPFDNDTIRNYSASKLFMGASCLSRSGLLESDPRLIQAERKILSQAEELIVLVDSSKFSGVGSLILCPLEKINIVISDEYIRDEDRQILADAGVSLLLAKPDPAMKIASNA
jgi:DeoR family ulaG and ulaABCDEF operon transcriptional repressor